MKPPPRDPVAEKKAIHQAKAIFTSLGFDNSKNRYTLSNGILTIQGYFKIRSVKKAKKAANSYDMLAQILEEQLEKIPQVQRVRLRLKGARKNNGRWSVVV